MTIPADVLGLAALCTPRVLLRFAARRAFVVIVRPSPELIPALHRARFVRTSSDAWTWVPTLH